MALCVPWLDRGGVVEVVMVRAGGASRAGVVARPSAEFRAEEGALTGVAAGPMAPFLERRKR